MSDIEERVEVWSDEIINLIRTPDVILGMVPHVISNADFLDISQIYQRDPRSASTYMIQHISQSRFEGKWQAFIDSLDKNGYEYLTRLLTGQYTAGPNHQYQKTIIGVFASKLCEQINSQEIVTSLVQCGIISETDKQEIKSKQLMYGQNTAAILLLDRIQCRLNPNEWYTGFLRVLMDNGHESLVRNIDPDYYAKPTIYDSRRTDADQQWNHCEGTGEWHYLCECIRQERKKLKNEQIGQKKRNDDIKKRIEQACQHVQQLFSSLQDELDRKYKDTMTRLWERHNDLKSLEKSRPENYNDAEERFQKIVSQGIPGKLKFHESPDFRKLTQIVSIGEILLQESSAEDSSDYDPAQFSFQTLDSGSSDDGSFGIPRLAWSDQGVSTNRSRHSLESASSSAMFGPDDGGNRRSSQGSGAESSLYQQPRQQILPRPSKLPDTLSSSRGLDYQQSRHNTPTRDTRHQVAIQQSGYYDQSNQSSRGPQAGIPGADRSNHLVSSGQAYNQQHAREPAPSRYINQRSATSYVESPQAQDNDPPPPYTRVQSPPTTPYSRGLGREYPQGSSQQVSSSDIRSPQYQPIGNAQNPNWDTRQWSPEAAGNPVVELTNNSCNLGSNSQASRQSAVPKYSGSEEVKQQTLRQSETRSTTTQSSSRPRAAMQETNHSMVNVPAESQVKGQQSSGQQALLDQLNALQVSRQSVNKAEVPGVEDAVVRSNGMENLDFVQGFFNQNPNIPRNITDVAEFDDGMVVCIDSDRQAIYLFDNKYHTLVEEDLQLRPYRLCRLWGNQLAILYEKTDLDQAGSDIRLVVFVGRQQNGSKYQFLAEGNVEFCCHGRLTDICCHGDKLYACCTDRHLHVYNFSTHQIEIVNLIMRTQGQWEPKYMDVNTDKNLLFITEEDSVVCFNISDGSMKWESPNLHDPRGVVFYQGFVYVAIRNNNNIAELSQYNGSRRQTYGAAILDKPIAICVSERMYERVFVTQRPLASGSTSPQIQVFLHRPRGQPGQ